MIRVAVDVTPLVLTRAGTARYVRGLLGDLVGVEVVRLGFGRTGRAATVARDSAWYLAGLPREARRRGADVLHCTTFRAPVRSSVPVVVTVHDLALLRQPELFTPWVRLYGSTLLRRVVRAAGRVIAVSEFTAREVVELCDVPRERVRVVPNGAGEPFVPVGEAAAGDYVLAVATLEPRKNLPRLVAATQRLGVELRVVGARGWGGVEVGGNGVRWLGEPDDEEVARLYRGALCVAYPSLYEGFGLPVLEALRCGAPVVTSAGTALEEVAGGAAELVDPYDVGAIAAGIERAIARRDELARLGPARAAPFTWRAAADATAAVYRELA